MSVRCSSLLALLLVLTGGVLTPPAAAQAPDPDPRPWAAPRTPEGHPDLQGNWTNATITPLQRREGQGAVLAAEQVARIEGRRAERIDELSRPSDPNRGAPPVGGDGSTGAAGGVGGYNYFYIDAGDRVAVYDGEPRSSLIVDPPDGRIPPLTAEGQARVAGRRAFWGEFGSYDNPENRPLGERCLISFGSSAGPPMLPNYFYNNNYTIVQTADHVVIMAEMVHDARIIRLGERRPLPPQVRPWMGDSWGRWTGDTLVVETTNLHPLQLDRVRIFTGASEDLTVIERFTRVDEHTINYEFTMHDPTAYTQPWTGQMPFKALPELVYEYACHEGNYALFNVLSGERAREREGGQGREPR